MSLSSPFIARPVATALLIVAIVLLGGTAYTLLPVSALPNVSFPTISVTAQLPGADPQTMASSVATPLEKQFGQIPYLTQMTSTSSLGYTSIVLQFALDDDINAAAQLVQTAINAASGQLPKNMPSPPTYHETNPSDAPILVLGLTSDTLPITTVDDYAESILAQKLSQIPGVGLVNIGGEQHPAIRLRVDPEKLSANGLDLEALRSALTNLSVDQPKGTLYGTARAYSLQTNDQILSTADWARQIIAYRNGGPIRVSDIGDVVIGPQDQTLEGWVNHDRGIILAVQRLPGANVISTVQAIRSALPKLMAPLPPTIKVSVISDRTITIRASVADVQRTLLLTIGLVVGVIFIFLRSVWATIIPAIAVPVSIIGTFGVMYMFGYSLDNLSLMGLSIAVGFVVDDAIVMVENIARHLEMGKSPMQSALDGASEIGFTILSMSISLIAVFIPLLLMGGLVGRMFQEFAVTVAAAIAVSAVVSLTLTPMMGARVLRREHPEAQGRLSRGLERGFNAMVSGYDRALIIALKHRFITLMIMLGTVALTVALFINIPKGFFPQQDTGLILGVTEAAEDISPDGMAVLQKQVVELALKNPGVASVGAYIGAGGATSTENQGRIFIALKPHGERASIGNIMRQISTAMHNLVGVRLFMQAVQDVNIGGRLTATQYQYTLSDVDLGELNRWAPIIQAALGKVPEITDLTSDQQSAAPQLLLSIDRQTASRLGITPADIDGVLYDAFGQRPISQLFTSLNQYYVILQVRPDLQFGPAALQRIYVKSQTSGMVPLSELVTLHETVVPLSVNHQGQFPSVTLSFNLKPNESLGTGRRRDPQRGLGARPAADTAGQLPGQCPGVSEFIVQHADPDPCSTDRGLHYSRHSLRKYHPSVDHPFHPALGRRRRPAHAAGRRARPRRNRHHRHHPADRHRQEKRHHAGRFRAACTTRARFVGGTIDSRSLRTALQADPDDNHVRPARRPAADAKLRHRLGTAQTPRLCHGRRTNRFTSVDAVHHAGDLHLHGQTVRPVRRRAPRRFAVPAGCG